MGWEGGEFAMSLWSCALCWLCALVMRASKPRFGLTLNGTSPSLLISISRNSPKEGVQCTGVLLTGNDQNNSYWVHTVYLWLN